LAGQAAFFEAVTGVSRAWNELQIQWAVPGDQAEADVDAIVVVEVELVRPERRVASELRGLLPRQALRRVPQHDRGADVPLVGVAVVDGLHVLDEVGERPLR
jgi:hypothetical protein